MESGIGRKEGNRNRKSSPLGESTPKRESEPASAKRMNLYPCIYDHDWNSWSKIIYMILLTGIKLHDLDFDSALSSQTAKHGRFRRDLGRARGLR